MLLFYICSIRQKAGLITDPTKQPETRKVSVQFTLTKTSQNTATRIGTMLKKFQSRIAYKLNSTMFSF